MGLSSDSLIHFTQDKQSLIDIINSEFKVSYCLENILTPKGNLAYGVPMVSFCDIPMSEIKKHITNYGLYGIGLKKEWGQAKKLNPVLYIDKNSSLGAGYKDAFDNLFKGRQISSTTESEDSLINIVRYMKNYEADLTRKGSTITNYRFADEKEWRYVPEKKDAQMLAKEADIIKNGKLFYTQKIAHLKLGFEPKDIKYIIISDENEISEFIDVLRRAKGNKYTLTDVERLMTRIVTTKQIFSDF